MSERFFIGWEGKTGPALGRFLGAAALLLLAGFGGLGWALSAGTDDPSAGLAALAPQPRVPPELPEPRRVAGVLERGPVPVLRTAPTPDRPQGETMFLVLYDKRGVPVPDDLYGKPVEIDGTIFRRGALLQLVSGGDFRVTEGALPPAVDTVPLGRWRIVGEVCDGKCYTGIMRPGSGLAHRACAALCFAGDVPAVFVAAAPVMGARYFLLADPEGRAPPPEARHLFGIPVMLEGEIERRGSLLVFRADFAGARRL